MRLWFRLQTKSFEVEVEEEEATGVEEEAGVVVLVDEEDAGEDFDRVLFETSLSVIILSLPAGLTIRAWGYWRWCCWMIELASRTGSIRLFRSL